MAECYWCGDQHARDQLCQRAQRGLTRRSFCFLFGAGSAAVVTSGTPNVFDESSRLGYYGWSLADDAPAEVVALRWERFIEWSAKRHGADLVITNHLW